MSLGLDSKISALPLRHQGPRLPPGRRKTPPFHSLFLCQVLRPLGANRNTRDQKGGMGGLSPPPCPCPWCLMLRNAPAGCTLPSMPHPCSRLQVGGQAGPCISVGGGQRVKGTDAGPFCTSLLGSRIYLVPSVISPSPALSCALGSLCPPSQPPGQGPSYTTEGPGDPSPPSAFPPGPQSSLAQGEGGGCCLADPALTQRKPLFIY